MACVDLNRVIEDKTLYIKQWPATIALENLSKALSTFGPNLGPFVEGDFMLGDVIALLNSSGDVVSLVKEFVSAARIDGKEVLPATFDKYYQKDLLFVFKVFSFVCEVQYKDFFEQGRNLQEPSPE